MGSERWGTTSLRRLLEEELAGHDRVDNFVLDGGARVTAGGTFW